MYSRQEIRAVATYYWHLRQLADVSDFCRTRMADFSKCYNLLDLEEKRALFKAVWLEDGSNVNLILDWMCDYLNGNI